MYIGKNTYEIESGLFSSEKTGKFYTVSRESTYSSQIINITDKVILNFEVMLDAKVTHYKSTTYGIIDAIGTLGGVFEILFWVLMLLYGSLRENMYLFSVINTLTEINQDEDAIPKTDNNNPKEVPMSENRFDQIEQI